MNPAIPVSWGELIDRATILEIKAERLTSESAAAKVRHELERLLPFVAEAESRHERIAPLKRELKRVNEILWQIEDDIRAKEREGVFDAEFIRLARSVYLNNDARGRLKQEINLLLQSDITEEKQYSPY